MGDTNPLYLYGLLYVFRCAIGGFVTIFLPIFFFEMGFDSFQIGIINTLSPFFVMFGSPVWGAIADQYDGKRKYLMIGLAIFSVLCLVFLVVIGLFLPKYTQFWLVLACICLSQFGAGSIGSLLDSLVVEQLPKNSYGKLRLWGAVGYGLSAGVVGVAMIYVKSEIPWLPYVTHFGPAIACALMSIGLMFLLDAPKSKESKLQSVGNIQSPPTTTDEDVDSYLTEKDSLTKKDKGHTLTFWQKIQKIPCTIEMLFFVLVIFVCGACMGIVASFLFLFIQNALHGSQLIMGVSVLVTCSFEVPVFYYSNRIFDEWISQDYALLASLFAYVLRFGMYWIMAANKMNPWYILIPETLHGLTFALMWSAAVTKVSNLITGIGLVNFAVGFISAVLMLGNAAGSLVGGLGIQRDVSVHYVWEVGTYVMSAATLIWLLISTYNYISKPLENLG